MVCSRTVFIQSNSRKTQVLLKKRIGTTNFMSGARKEILEVG